MVGRCVANIADADSTQLWISEDFDPVIFTDIDSLWEHGGFQ